MRSATHDNNVYTIAFLKKPCIYLSIQVCFGEGYFEAVSLPLSDIPPIHQCHVDSQSNL